LIEWGDEDRFKELDMDRFKRFYKVYTVIFLVIIFFVSMTLFMLFEHPLIDKVDDFFDKHETVFLWFAAITIPLYLTCCIYLAVGIFLLINEILIFLKIDSRKR